MKINYIIGDATKPIVKEFELSVICHCCNTLGAWGAGFVIPLGNRYPEARLSYKRYVSENNKSNLLGKVDFVRVEDNIVVANIFGQDRLGKSKDGTPALDYEALENGFNEVYEVCSTENKPFTIHMPRIGCGLAGGDWKIVESIIEKCFCKREIEVFVYDLK